MIPEALKKALADYKAGRIEIDALSPLLLELPYRELEFAKVDHHREMRHGFPEVILGLGKTSGEILAIARTSLATHSNLLITRTDLEVYENLKADFANAEFHQRSRSVTVLRDVPRLGRGAVAVVSAGTADIPVAEEALVTLRSMGNRAFACYDVGVAGIHRLLDQRERLRKCSAIVVAAGMEGALPSVVAGLVDLPVVAVPTSVGYGASFSGLAALLGMLNSCSPNVTVVNIDNGFGAGYAAALINRRREFDSPYENDEGPA